MSTDSNHRGSASGEYLAVVGVVMVVFGALLVFRPHTVSRHVPVDVISPIARLLGQPLRDPGSPRGSGPPTQGQRPRHRRPSPPRPERPRIMLPEWWTR